MKKVVATLLALALCFALTACNSSDYKKAMNLYNSGSYAEARTMFVELENYKDSADMVIACDYCTAKNLLEAGEYGEAADVFFTLADYEDSAELYTECQYNKALELLVGGEYEESLVLWRELGDYQDSAKNRMDTAWAILRDYIIENGKTTDDIDFFTRSIQIDHIDNLRGGKGTTYIGILPDDVDSFFIYSDSYFGQNFGVNINLNKHYALVTLKRYENDAHYELYSTSMTAWSSNSVYQSTLQADGSIDISTATAGTDLPLNNFKHHIKNYDGSEEDADDADRWNMEDEKKLYSFIFSDVPVLFSQCDLEITLADLGFLSCE